MTNRSKNPLEKFMSQADCDAMQRRMRLREIEQEARDHTFKTQPMIDENLRKQRLAEMARRVNPVLGY